MNVRQDAVLTGRWPTPKPNYDELTKAEQERLPVWLRQETRTITLDADMSDVERRILEGRRA